MLLGINFPLREFNTCRFSTANLLRFPNLREKKISNHLTWLVIKVNFGTTIYTLLAFHAPFCDVTLWIWVLTIVLFPNRHISIVNKPLHKPCLWNFFQYAGHSFGECKQRTFAVVSLEQQRCGWDSITKDRWTLVSAFGFPNSISTVFACPKNGCPKNPNVFFFKLLASFFSSYVFLHVTTPKRAVCLATKRHKMVLHGSAWKPPHFYQIRVLVNKTQMWNHFVTIWKSVRSNCNPTFKKKSN